MPRLAGSCSPPTELHVTAKLSGALQQTDSVCQCRASEEPHIDVGREGVDVREACISDTRTSLVSAGVYTPTT